MIVQAFCYSGVVLTFATLNRKSCHHGVQRPTQGFPRSSEIMNMQHLFPNALVQHTDVGNWLLSTRVL